MLAALSLLATLTWSSYDEALVRAKTERKLVIVHLRATTANANREPDAKLERAAAHENIALLLQSFVLARRGGPIPEIGIRPPALVALDPDGRFLLAMKIGHAEEIGATLAELREHAEEILRSRDMRETAPAAVADAILGREIVYLRDAPRGAKLLEKAARELRKAGLTEMALYAELWIGVAQYSADRKKSGRITVQAVVNDKAAPPAVRAEGWCILGDMAIAEREREDAIAYYRKAYDLAPAGSNALRRARRELETYDPRLLPPKAQERVATVRLITPARRSMTGRVEVVVEADPGVASAELFLDDVRMGSDDKPPFRMTVDVGPAAMMRTLRAVGYDGSGEPIGEDVATINDRVDAFRVAITAPTEPLVKGPASIEADVHAPEHRKLERLEVYWKERLLATLHAPPFRTIFRFPDEFGYVRVVGVLDDGTTAEDARIVNAMGGSASVDVHAVTLYATVTDADGNRVEGLTAADFIVQDEGTPVPVSVLRTTDTPVTIGLAIDSSSSMRQWMFQALELATGFVKSGEGSEDRTFVTAFDDAPRLLHEPSADMESLRRRILDITIRGGTSIYDGVIFALQQFQDVPGRKALLVISDGREGASSQSPAAAIRTARAAAIPIYSLTPQIALSLRSLSEETGGVAFHGTRASEQPAVFARIRDDVRGQYLITFEPRPAKAGTWRKVSVSTRREDLKVRTVSGYYVR